MTIVYDRGFNGNEWYIISTLVISSIIIFFTPKAFTLLESIAYYLFGIFTGMFFDHTISVPPWDFYDVNDLSKYEFFDFLSYIMYGPYSYFFIYLHFKLNVKGYMNILYISLWTIFSLLTEWIALKIGIFHYNKGYSIYWSPMVYVFFQTLQVMLYKLIKAKQT